MEKRTKVVKEHRLCFNCLKAGHGVAYCRLSKSCSHCHRRHNTLLHRNVSNSSAPPKKTLSFEPKKNTSVIIASNQCAAKINQCGRKLHKVLLVSIWVDNPCKSLTTWAFTDETSVTSLCTRELAKRLNAPLIDCKVGIYTTNAVTPVNTSFDSVQSRWNFKGRWKTPKFSS